MINCQIVQGSANRKRAAESFVDQTVHYACVTDLTSAYLAFNLSEDTEFKIVVDEIDIHRECCLPEGHHERSLAQILTTANIQPTEVDGIWTKPRAGKSDDQVVPSVYPRTFKVVFRRTDGSDQVVACFDFHLLDENKFQDEFDRYRDSHQPKPINLHSRCNDAGQRSDNCSSCGGYLGTRSTCRNCGKPRVMPTGSDWSSL